MSAPVNEYKANLPAEVVELNKYFDKFMARFVSETAKENELDEAQVKRLNHLFEYNCLGGKAFRGVQVVTAVRKVCELKGKDFESVKESAFALAWAVEVLQACFLVADDIMDKSETRRGQPCWYKLPDVQMDAVNDSLILESFMYHLIEVYVPDATTYRVVLKLFQDVMLKTQLGQMLDLVSQPQGRKGLEVLNTFNSTLQKRIVKYKTAFYTFYLPMACGLVLAGVTGAKELNATKEICIELGEKFQIQDDYLDCYGDPKMIGKVGTDIQDHKCTWLLTQALLIVTPAQRKVIETHYGHEDAASIKAIKDLYNELNMPAIYAKQEEDSMNRLTTLLKKYEDIVSPTLFEAIIKRVHGRQK